MREIILKEFMDVMSQANATLRTELSDEAVLLETGMDSLGFAILVAQLETKLGYDPFSLMDQPYYPVTFGDFVQIYERYRPDGNL
ncbi:hypothetical protein [Geomesophilobacter sediminis]|uniref:Carrier domain-containing protein n=1 Tax=Geomesophilobacter sediminis TaxID=2798584 RepID=A0A8J7M3M8_9BACT|nr:hypothetical protein [Geomesophilobacter sediminis]MBJ6727563.1 hypothetical protein [Geomesophilobacter sediminis]